MPFRSQFELVYPDIYSFFSRSTDNSLVDTYSYFKLDRKELIKKPTVCDRLFPPTWVLEVFCLWSFFVGFLFVCLFV